MPSPGAFCIAISGEFGAVVGSDLCKMLLLKWSRDIELFDESKN